jgi:hypothetical protein
MKRILSYFIALALMMGVVLGLSPIVVSADNEDLPTISVVSPPAQDAGTSGAIAQAIQNVNDDIHAADIFTGDTARGVVTEDFLIYDSSSTADIVNIKINMQLYKNLKQSAKQDVMQYALSGIYNSTISRTNKNKIYNELCALDTSTSSLVRQLSDDVNADFNGAYKYFRPFSGPIGIILGLFSVAIFGLLAITIVVDIAFMTIPFIQTWLWTESEEKAKFVSLEAVSAVKESASKVGTPEYKSPINYYFRTKTKQLAAISICLLYLVSGKIYIVLAQIIDYFSGILG